MNENPKVIQQLLGHRDIKTTIMVYNFVNSDYVREAMDSLNAKIQDNQKVKELTEEEIENFEMTNDEIEERIRELEELQERKRK